MIYYLSGSCCFTKHIDFYPVIYSSQRILTVGIITILEMRKLSDTLIPSNRQVPAILGFESRSPNRVAPSHPIGFH